jgi:hypothetical protein
MTHRLPLRCADRRQLNHGFVQTRIDKACARRPGIRKTVAGGSAARSRAFGNEPSRWDMLIRKIHVGMVFAATGLFFRTRPICLTAASPPSSKRNPSDPSQTSHHFPPRRPHPSRTFVLRPAKHLYLRVPPQVTAAQHSSSAVPVASDAACEPQALLPSARRPRCPWPEPMEETMRVLSQGELSRCTRAELATLLRRIACDAAPGRRLNRASQRAHEPANSAGRSRGPTCGPKPGRVLINWPSNGSPASCAVVTGHRLVRFLDAPITDSIKRRRYLPIGSRCCKLVDRL